MGARAVFIDRDGVINRYPGDGLYVTSRAGFRFLPKAKEAVALLTKKGYSVFVISNQAGVGKGVYAQGALDEITRHMTREVEKSGGRFTAVYYCTHHPDEGCACRKPKAGMVERARREHRTGKGKGFFIGDTIRDINTARSAGLTSILVLSGKEKWAFRAAWETQPDFVFRNLYAAVKFIIRSSTL